MVGGPWWEDRGGRTCRERGCQVGQKGEVTKANLQTIIQGETETSDADANDDDVQSRVAERSLPKQWDE